MNNRVITDQREGYCRNLNLDHIRAVVAEGLRVGHLYSMSGTLRMKLTLCDLEAFAVAFFWDNEGELVPEGFMEFTIN